MSKWYNQRFKHKIELEQDPQDRWKDFHSFRKTFSSYLLHKDVPDKRVKQVIGHSVGSDTLNRHYFEDFEGKELPRPAPPPGSPPGVFYSPVPVLEPQAGIRGDETLSNSKSIAHKESIAGGASSLLRAFRL